MTSRETQQLVTVIIPTFNRAKLIGRAIDSVIQQTYAALEIIIADDASTDGTDKLVSAIEDSRIRYLRSERNAGASAARNLGIAAATGEFVAFLDSDDVWMPDKLELQLAAIQCCDHPQEAVCYTQIIIDRGDTRTLMPRRAMRSGEPVADFFLGHEGLIHTSSLLLSRSLAERNLFPVDQKKHEDWDLFLRLEQAGVDWVYVDRPLVVWHNEPREGRLTNLSYELSLDWLRTHEARLSPRARSGFMFKEVAAPLINGGQRRVYALGLVTAAVLHGAVAPVGGVRTMVRVLVPRGVREKLKSLLSR